MTAAELPMHQVPCVGCEKPLSRKYLFRPAKCEECKQALRQRNWRAELVVVRNQARALRVVLFECGYDWASFKEFRADLRASNLHEADRRDTKTSKGDRTRTRRLWRRAA